MQKIRFRYSIFGLNTTIPSLRGGITAIFKRLGDHDRDTLPAWRDNRRRIALGIHRMNPLPTRRDYRPVEHCTSKLGYPLPVRRDNRDFIYFLRKAIPIPSLHGGITVPALWSRTSNAHFPPCMEEYPLDFGPDEEYKKIPSLHGGITGLW